MAWRVKVPTVMPGDWSSHTQDGWEELTPIVALRPPLMLLQQQQNF